MQDPNLINIAAVDDTGESYFRAIKGLRTDGDYLSLVMALYGTSGFALTDRQPSADALSDTTPRGLDTIGYPYLYDPYNDVWNRQRGNHAATLLTSAARTATVNSTDQTNHNARGVHVIINVSAYPAAASVVPAIEAYDEVAGIYYPLLTGAAIVATGYTILKVYPGIGEVANGAASDVLPQTWRVLMTHADADSITYSVGAQLVL